MRERISGWGARLSFAALLFVFSELVVWQSPTEFTILEWLGLALLYLALSALALDLIARFNVNDPLGLLLVAGMYGLINSTLISHITANDLPLSLVVRPLGAQPLAFLGALASFRILNSERATGPFEFMIALLVGLLWGIWVRWFPVVSDVSIPTVKIAPALLAVGGALVACWLLRLMLGSPAIYRHDDWRLLSIERAACVAVLVVALFIGAARDVISASAVFLVAALVAFFAGVLFLARPPRRKLSFLALITPPRRPNPAAWLMLIMPFLLAGWLGYHLPGSGDSSTQSDVLFAILTGFGAFWPPVVSGVLGTRAFIQLARQGG